MLNSYCPQRDLNGPTDLAVDAGSLYVIEANRTQLTKLSDDGRVLWRVQRFQGLTWVLADPATGGAWVGASMFDGRVGGVLRVAADGSIARVAAGPRPEIRADWRRRRFSADAVRSARTGRLYLQDDYAIAILSAEGALPKRVDGYRFPNEQRVRR